MAESPADNESFQGQPPITGHSEAARTLAWEIPTDYESFRGSPQTAVGIPRLNGTGERPLPPWLSLRESWRAKRD